ncbi:MAG: FHA domain-containing protein [Sulfitobacter sp.]
MSNFALETHVSFLRERGRLAGRSMVPTIAPPRLGLRVSDGLQANATASLDVERVTIGCDPECDIVMPDEGVAPQHAILDMRRTLFGDAVAVTALAQDVSIEGRAIAIGERSPYLRAPNVVRMGPVSIVIEATSMHTGAPLKRRSMRRAAIGAAALLAAIVIPAEFYQSSRADWDVISSEKLAEIDAVRLVSLQQNRPISIDDATYGPTLPLPSEADAMNAELARMELDRFLKAESWNDGSVLVSGSLPTNMFGAWQAAHVAFDKTHSSSNVISQVERAPELRAFPTIAAVRLGAAPEIIFVSGQRAGIGDKISSDWTITDIAEGSLTLERGFETLDVAF